MTDDKSGFSTGDIPADQIPDDVGMPVEGLPDPLENADGLAEMEEHMPSEADYNPEEGKPDESKPEESEKAEDVEGAPGDLGDEAAEEPEAAQPTIPPRILEILSKQYGIDLSDASPEEVTSLLERNLLTTPPEVTPEAKPDAQSQAAPIPSSLDEVFKKYDDHFSYEDDKGITHAGLHPAQRQLFNDLTEYVVNKTAQSEVVQSLMQTVGITLFHNWYADAAKAAGDAPIPPADYAFTQLQKHPELAQEYFARFQKMGQVDWNPMKRIFNQWSSEKTASGETKARAAERDAQAKKVKQMKATPAPGALKPKKPPTMDEMEQLLDSVRPGQF